MSSKIKALLATGRVSNLPTVWCNCLAAALLIFHATPIIIELYCSDLQFPVGSFYLVGMILIISSSFLYVGGCFLGDAIDVDFDKKHKPNRPIPSGLISRKTIFISSWLMLIIGLLAPITLHLIPNPTHTFLIAPKIADYSWQQMTCVPFLFLAIVLYSIFHKRYPIVGLPLIGLCRFSLVIFSASITIWLATTYILTEKNDVYIESAVTAPYFILPIIIFASAVCLYTICFASVARTESSNSPITWRNILRYTMLSLPLLALISKTKYHGEYLQIAALVAIAIYALWMIHAFSYLSKNKGIYVSKCLAGFCLLDACFVAQFGWVWLIICLALFGLSLALQKIAPAT